MGLAASCIGDPTGADVEGMSLRLEREGDYEEGEGGSAEQDDTSLRTSESPKSDAIMFGKTWTDSTTASAGEPYPSPKPCEDFEHLEDFKSMKCDSDMEDDHDMQSFTPRHLRRQDHLQNQMEITEYLKKVSEFDKAAATLKRSRSWAVKASTPMLHLSQPAPSLPSRRQNHLQKLPEMEDYLVNLSEVDKTVAMIRLSDLSQSCMLHHRCRHRSNKDTAPSWS